MLEFQKCENVRVVPGLSNILKIKCVHISYYVTLGEGEGVGGFIQVPEKVIWKMF